MTFVVLRILVLVGQMPLPWSGLIVRPGTIPTHMRLDITLV